MSIFFIFLFWLIFLPLSLYNISEKISVIGIYHKLDEENFQIKIRKMLETNYVLSYPLVFSIFAYVKSAIPTYNSVELFYFSIGVSLVALLTMRLLANPSNFLKPRLCHLCPSSEHNKIIEVYKERIISFFYSFVCAMVFLIMAYWTNYIITNEKLLEKLTDIFTDIGFEQVLKILATYAIFLVLITFIGELVLKKTEPIIQMNVPKSKNVQKATKQKRIKN